MWLQIYEFPFLVTYNGKWIVTTLALGSRPRQGGYKVAGQEGGPGVTSHALGSGKECERMNPHTPKWTPIVRIGVSNGLPNFQSAISRVKTHWFEEFFILLENYWNVDV
jgi:hypothetical protein